MHSLIYWCDRRPNINSFVFPRAVVSIRLMESNVTVQESVRSVVVCVRISKRIARVLAFRVTTRNGTAKGELINLYQLAIATMNNPLL